MAELSEPRLGNAITSEAETSWEPYESVPLNVESTYVAYRVGLQRRGFASGMQWIFFPRNESIGKRSHCPNLASQKVGLAMCLFY
jgi:hypothetical protein